MNFFKLEIKTSTIFGAGLGLFSLEDIPEGEVVAEFDGIRHDPLEKLSLKEEYYSFGTKRVTIVPFENCVLRFANDIVNLPKSLEENKVTYFQNLHYNIDWEILKTDAKGLEKDFVCAVSLCDIEKGEELFINYNKEYWIQLFKDVENGLFI